MIITKATGRTIEDDMNPCKYEESERLSSKVFKVYPLIGDFSPGEKTLNKWFDVTCKYIEKRLDIKSARFYDWVYDQVALTVIHYAKSWNSNEEGKFTRYITMQLGYKDESGRIWNLLCDALETAFKQHNRLFIRRNGERQFYETVMVHSFGPNGAWYPMIDLLFSFYTDNLDWTYLAGDPLFPRLVRVLQGYFNNTEIEDDQYDIASGRYSLRIGIRRLVQERPGYCAYLFELIVKRIQQLLKNEAGEPKRYIHQVVDQWFTEKISRSSVASKKRISASAQKTVDLALDYSKINLKYIVSEGRLALRIPAIRLLDDEQGPVIASLYDGEQLADRCELEVRGNELGETIKQKTIILPTDKLLTDELRYRLVIIRGNTEIYNSENKLWRQLVFFADEKEIGLNRLHKEKYDVFVPDYSRLNGKNFDVVTHMHGMCEMSLHKDYVLEYAGNTLAIDTSDIKGVRIIRPSVIENARYISDGEEYYLIAGSGSLKVYFEKEDDAKKYRVAINGENHSLAEFYDEFAGNRSVIPVDGEDEITTLTIIDIAAGTVLFTESYYLVTDFRCVFNRKIYVTDEEYEGLSAQVSIGGEVFKCGASSENEIRFDYKNGTIAIDIPGIRVSYFGITTLFFDRYLRAADISDESRLIILNHTGIHYTLTIGEAELGEAPGAALSEYVSGKHAGNDTVDIILSTAEKKYILGQIVFGNLFAQSPGFIFRDNCLYWDGGSSYIGDADAVLTLALMKNGAMKYPFDLQLGKQLIYDFKSEEFPDGYYDWAVFVNEIPVAQGNSFFGNVSKARFAGKIIRIDQVTEDIEDNARPVSVKTVYIDQIQYRDTCYVETEEDVYDVYSGCMYWIDWHGERRYYSFKYNDKSSRYKVNPVKIIYISDKYLRIVNEDDEGIFYFYKDDSYAPGNEITDREPRAGAKNYHDILFYLFDVSDSAKTGISAKPEIPVSIEKVAFSKLSQVKSREVEEKTHSPEIPSLKHLQTVTQETVIHAGVEERILVNAGPGTGKTWTLIERIINLVQNGTEPENIQVLCFSRAAVDVVRKRMAEAVAAGRVEPVINLVDIRTFDSFASQLLYWVKDSDYTEIGKNVRIESLNYEERIDRFTEVLKAQPGLIEQCEHLIVDEVQDLVMSRAEMVLEMIHLLPADCGVTLFGDACQAIYDYQVDSGMSSDNFYKQIEETKQFSYYSFDRNYRQTSRLQEYCSEYRKAILSGEEKACNDSLAELQETLPDYNTLNLQLFEEDSLDPLLKSGNVGILTRSNAQALVISGMFHRKNISHLLQRRLSDNSLNGWIGVLFNTLPDHYYDEDSFSEAFAEMFPDQYNEEEVSDIWNMISSFGTGGMVSVADLLRGIRDNGRSDRLYLTTPESRVTVSTIHRSKGREYDAVIILDSLISEKPDSMEEQRVNYVALSRAKERMYKVQLPQVYFRTLENRRSYSQEKNFRKGTSYLRFFEVGRTGDFSGNGFCRRDGVQQFLRDNYRHMKDKEVYLEKTESETADYVTYYMRLKENDMILGETGRLFAEDLESAIRKIKNLPWHATVYDYVYPKRFNGIYITDIGSEIGMIQGNEKGIREFDSLATWNTILVEGYARAEY